ncbi:hypothetical protein BJ742DRAFT_472775 [Cladochytrium replicatum]|nr:hypothetical protein BJ742DRAFT_472775 [Cladochytrium replicatum]
MDYEETTDTLRADVDSANLNVQQLHEELAKLDAKLNQAEKEKADLRKRLERDTQIQTTLADKGSSLEELVTSLRSQMADVDDELENARLELADATKRLIDGDKRHDAHVVVIRMLEKDLNDYKKRVEELQNEVDYERRKREGGGEHEDGTQARLGVEQYISIIEDLRTENVELSDQNRILLEEIDSFRVMISVRGRSATNMSLGTPEGASTPNSTWELLEESAAARKERRLRNPPPRVSSAVSLPNAPGGSLSTELLKTEHKKAEQTELEKLREENRALVTYIVSTLDSVTKLAASK